MGASSTVRDIREAPLISVIVPCFNQGRYLAEALTSVADQTHRNWECLIIDDGSSDNTAEVASRFVAGDSRYRYFHHANRGPSASRNRGLSLAQGELIQFLDADDVILPDKLERQVVALGERGPLKVAHCDYSRGRADCIAARIETGRRSTRFIYRKPIYDLALRWETELSIPIHCFLFDARIFRDHGIRFDESLAAHEDWDCWIQVFALEPESVFLDSVLAIYRLSGSVTSNLRVLYAGFLVALAKQRRVWRGDPVMRQLLELKRRRIKRHYKPQLRGKGLGSSLLDSFARTYARTIPWPLQQALARFREARLELDAQLQRAITPGRS